MKIPLKEGRVVVVGDCHFPHIDKRAWALALATIEKAKPTHVVSIGDWWDAQSVSLHPAEFGKRADLASELKSAQKGWQELKQASGRAQLYMTLGNHDHWALRYVAKSAPALEGLMPSFHELYSMSDDVTVTPYRTELKIGRVVYVHDVGFCGANSARQTLAAVNHNVVFGHVHRGTVVYNGDTNGKQRFAMSVGWLGCPKSITYAPPARTREWQHGLGLVDYENGLAFAQFLPFVGGCTMLNGRLVKA